MATHIVSSGVSKLVDDYLGADSAFSKNTLCAVVNHLSCTSYALCGKFKAELTRGSGKTIFSSCELTGEELLVEGVGSEKSRTSPPLVDSGSSLVQSIEKSTPVLLQGPPPAARSPAGFSPIRPVPVRPEPFLHTLNALSKSATPVVKCSQKTAQRIVVFGPVPPIAPDVVRPVPQLVMPLAPGARPSVPASLQPVPQLVAPVPVPSIDLEDQEQSNLKKRKRSDFDINDSKMVDGLSMVLKSLSDDKKIALIKEFSSIEDIQCVLRPSNLNLMLSDSLDAFHKKVHSVIGDEAFLKARDEMALKRALNHKHDRCLTDTSVLRLITNLYTEKPVSDILGPPLSGNAAASQIRDLIRKKKHLFPARYIFHFNSTAALQDEYEFTISQINFDYPMQLKIASIIQSFYPETERVRLAEKVSRAKAVGTNHVEEWIRVAGYPAALNAIKQVIGSM